MLYYTNDKISVFAHTRCAGTNMRHYFNVGLNELRQFPTQFSNDLIIVLRNPLDRVVSAVKGMPEVMHLIAPYEKINLEKVLGREVSMEDAEEIIVFGLHCRPYIKLIKDQPFKIIDFYHIHDYIPRRTDVVQSPNTYSNGHTDPKSVYVENSCFTLSDLEEEYSIYKSLLAEREQISIAEWKEKTS